MISTVTKLSSYEYANNGSILTALKLILSWHKKTTEDMCSDIFEISEDIYQKKLNKIFSKYQKSTQNKYISNGNKIFEYAKSIKNNNCLPESFSEAIMKVHSESGMSIYQVSKIARINKTTVSNIVFSKSTPSNYKTILKLEQAYKLDQYTLLSKINLNKNDSSISRDEFPIKYLKQKGKIVPHLKNLKFDFKEQTTEKKEEICEWIMTNIVVNNNKYCKKNLILSQETYRYSEIENSPNLKRELDTLTQIKTSKIPLVNFKRKKIWASHTLKININFLLYFFGWLNKYSDLNISKIDYSLTILLDKEIIHKYISYRFERRGEMCVSEINFLKLLASLLDSKYGLLPQAYDLFVMDKTLLNYINKKQTSVTKSDWIDICEETRSYYKDMHSEIMNTMKQTHVDRNGSIKKSRDPFFPIQPILDHEQPLKKYLELLCSLRQNFKNNTSPKIKELVFYTGYLSAMILLQSGIRANNFLSLKSTLSETEEFESIIIKDNELIVDIPAHKTKNNVRNYCSVVDTNNLYNDIKHYIELKKLIFQNNCEYFFVTKNNTPFTTDSFSSMISKFTKKYIAYNQYKVDPGIPGLQSHGPHAFRDIIATHVIKTTGSYSLAALAINDSEATVRKHYARFLPNDKNNIIKKITNEIFDI